MTELAEFLLARIAEDEQRARVTTPGNDRWRAFPMEDIAGCSVYDDQWLLATVAWYDHNKPMSNAPDATGPAYINSDRLAEHIAHWDPARVLAECDAKQRIVQYVAELEPPLSDGHWEGHGSNERWVQDVEPLILCLLALPYADHPDFREEWRPEWRPDTPHPTPA